MWSGSGVGFEWVWSGCGVDVVCVWSGSGGELGVELGVEWEWREC